MSCRLGPGKGVSRITNDCVTLQVVETMLHMGIFEERDSFFAKPLLKAGGDYDMVSNALVSYSIARCRFQRTYNSKTI